MAGDPETTREWGREHSRGRCADDDVLLGLDQGRQCLGLHRVEGLEGERAGEGTLREGHLQRRDELAVVLDVDIVGDRHDGRIEGWLAKAIRTKIYPPYL